MTNDEKVTKFQTKIVFFPSYLQAYTILEKAVECTRLRGVPSSAILFGPSGSGKSTLLEIFCNAFSQGKLEIGHDGLYRTIPALLCEVPAKATIKQFAKEILHGLQCSDYRGDSTDLEFRILELLKTHKTEFIAIDEFHQLAQPDTIITAGHVTSWLLSLLNRSKIPIIVTGLEGCKEVIYRTKPLARRYPFIAELRHLTFDERKSSEYMMTLQYLDQELYEIGELKKGIHLTDPSISTRLFIATQGNLEFIRLILSNAFQACLKRGDRELTTSDFLEVCSFLELDDSLVQDQNPFEIGLKQSYSIISGALE
ncbi:TniB family NTP-binding protein [Metapseudomonas resinovorans]|uniref:TniB family NTP-binding protein n=1 Tax=Metapseudomonas resinovorans TaxID=53412 RepID=UPI0009DB836B|nr:TniB family NTP-binding protein [Pseudomonas resinovorans]